jgi:glutathione S-transferase
MQNKLVLVLHKVCPFAQRSWITAIEKGVPFDLKEVSLKDKEEYFKETYKKSFPNDPNSDGKVPILIDGETVLC